MADITTLTKENTEQTLTLPVSFVPTPTREYREHRRLMRAAVGPTVLPIPLPTPTPTPSAAPGVIPPPGVRALIWKQDPTIGELGVRKVFLPGRTLAGPRDARITTQGLPIVSPNALGDYIATPNTEAFDAVHTFAVVRQTLTMYRRALKNTVPLPWQWNSPSNVEPIRIFPRAGDMMNAYYSRSEKAIKFFQFTKPGSPPDSSKVHTCRSLDIVAHETGHAILDGLKPGWLAFNNPPQTGGLHEAFGDLTAIFLTLSQLDQVEAIIAQTKSDLHSKTFLADLAEEFGLALGRPNGLRNADNDFNLSQVGNEVHAISQVFTGGIYDVLADIFSFERQPAKQDDAVVLYEVSLYVCSLVLRAYIAAPNARATYADVVNQMIKIAHADGKPAEYRNFIRDRFALREVVVAPTTARAAPNGDVELLTAFVQDVAGVAQNRNRCCGTMQLEEYHEGDARIDEEIEEFRKSLSESKPDRRGK